MPQEFDAGMCNERSGFLFKHECNGAPRNVCDRCQKPVCIDHSHQIDAELICTTCSRKTIERRDSRSGRRVRGRDYDDTMYGSPFFYSHYYYNGYGHYGRGGWGHHHHHGVHHGAHGDASHDPNDFHEADSESLVSDGAGESFEEDMGGS